MNSPHETETRKAELLSEYPRGYVDHPGKFEGEPIAAIYFYELMLDGAADETIYDGGTPVDVFSVDADDRAVWGFDDTTTYVAIYTTEQGCVMWHEWTAVDYAEAVDACTASDDAAEID